MSVRDALDNAFSDWFHGEGVENKTDDSPGDAAIAALRALPPEEIAKALEWETRDGIVDAVAETALGYRAALERIAEAKPYRLTHREIASIARLALTDAARIEDGTDGWVEGSSDG